MSQSLRVLLNESPAAPNIAQLITICGHDYEALYRLRHRSGAPIPPEEDAYTEAMRLIHDSPSVREGIVDEIAWKSRDSTELRRAVLFADGSVLLFRIIQSSGDRLLATRRWVEADADWPWADGQPRPAVAEALL